MHAGREPALARKIGVKNLPALVLLLDEKSYIYKETLSGVQKIIGKRNVYFRIAGFHMSFVVLEFIRGKLPYKMVPVIDDNNIDEFLNGWSDNKVRGLVLEKQSSLRLRYLVTAFHFRDRVAFG